MKTTLKMYECQKNYVYANNTDRPLADLTDISTDLYSSQLHSQLN